jgi:hypothetical protein
LPQLALGRGAGGKGEIVTISFRIPTTLVFLVACVIVKQPAAAMDFSIKKLSDGDQFVLAKGEIVAGDAERLQVALRSLGRNRFGNKEIALESGGGLVAEAFKMVRLMDQGESVNIRSNGSSVRLGMRSDRLLGGRA